MTDLRQTSQYANFMQSVGWQVEKISTKGGSASGRNNTYCYIRKMPIVGSFIKIQRPEKLLSEENIKRLKQKYKSYQIIVEPLTKPQADYYKKLGFKIMKSSFVPSKTIRINLLQSKQSLLRAMHYKTRYNTKHSLQTKDIKTKKSNDIKAFSDLWHTTRKQRLFFLRSDKQITNLYKAFGKDADLLFAYHKKQLVAAVCLISTKDTVYYMYAGSTVLGKKLFAPTLLVWESLLLGKNKGKKVFDFEGIYDERFPLDSWKGFSRFKKSFGGKEIEHPGAFLKTFWLEL